MSPPLTSARRDLGGEATTEELGMHGEGQSHSFQDIEQGPRLAQEQQGSPRYRDRGPGSPKQAGRPREAPPWQKLLNKAQWIFAFFAVLEYPFVLLRRATIPLVEAEGYSRPWFLVSLVGAPLAVCLYLELPWQAFVIAGGAGALAALVFGFFVPVVGSRPIYPRFSSSPLS